ncbi:MAG: SprT-like domain-containing protein [Halobacteriaceae archaeon]
MSDIESVTERHHVSPDCSREEFLAVCKVYAREIVRRFGLSVDVSALSWEVSTRAKRRAGVVEHRDGDPETVRLTWEHFETQGWEAAAATVRHELAHVHLLNEQSDAGHGADFRRLADELETTVHCDRFAEPTYWVVCDGCGSRLPRYRRSKLVENPETYRCGACGHALRAVRNEE